MTLSGPQWERSRRQRLAATLARAGLRPRRRTLDALLGLRIACMGNMNNNFFALVRYLREAGFDAHLLLYLHEQPHFMPDADTFGTDHAAYTRTLPWGDDIVSLPPERLRADLDEFGFLIACSIFPAFVEKAGRVVDVFVPYGSDLYEVPFVWGTEEDRHRSPNRTELGRRQRAAIEAARFVHMADPGFDHLLAELRPDGATIRCPLPMVYVREHFDLARMDRLPDTPAIVKFRQIRQQSPFVVFHHARHVWRTWLNKYSAKGNDKLIRAFAALVRQAGNADAHLICFEYGPDVAASRELIAELGIAGNVTWMPLMHRKEILAGLGFCDVATGDFGYGWQHGGVIYEAVAMGKPLIHHWGAFPAGINPPVPFPGIQAETVDEIAKALLDGARDPAKFAQLGRSAAHVFQKSIVDGPIDTYAGRILHASLARIAPGPSWFSRVRSRIRAIVKDPREIAN